MERGKPVKQATVQNEKLLALLKRVKPFAGKDTTLPALNSIHLVERDGVLYAEATDRFRMILRKAAHGGPEHGVTVDKGFEALIRLSDVDMLIQQLRNCSKLGATFLTVNDDNEVEVTTVANEAGKLTVTQCDAQYPPIHKLIPSLDQLSPDGWVFLDPRRIKDLTLAGDRSPRLVWAIDGHSGKTPRVVFSAEPEMEIGMVQGLAPGTDYAPLERLRSQWAWLTDAR